MTITISIIITLGVVLMFGLALLLCGRRGRGVSIIIPFRSPRIGDERVRNLNWLMSYWAAVLPGAELIVSDDPSAHLAFSKSAAINAGVARSKGDVLVLVDADGFIDVDSLMHCVDEIRAARKKKRKLWYMPYRLFYRLTNDATLRLINSDLKHLYQFPTPIASEDIILANDANPKTAHWYGALIQVMPREAFTAVGGWDERFRGWGGEDHAAMRAMDTLYGPHKTLPGRVLHLWHPQLGDNGSADSVHWKERRWEGQEAAGANNKLSHRYYHAHLKPLAMRSLVDEWLKQPKVDPAPAALPALETPGQSA